MVKQSGAGVRRARGARRGIARTASLALLALATGSLAACGEPYGAPVRVVIPEGASFAVTADSLVAKKIVRTALPFRVYAKATGRDRRVRAGTYRLQRNSSWASVLDALTSGRTVSGTITVPEGWALSAIIPQLARVLDVPRDSVEAAVRDTALLRRLDVPTPTLEGYLYPDTYTFADGTSARAAVATMVRAFEARWKPEWETQLQALAMSRHDVMTMASIVEKEAVVPEERAVISAVYHNRLKKRMYLQADPTVQYALGRHVARVLYRDLDIDSPYNTYRRAGLPPGPIASPGLPSIVAALNPASVPYLFFVATEDGHHEFRTTFAEHTAAIQEIRKRRATQARSSGSVADR